MASVMTTHAKEWKPAQNTIMSRWAAGVTPENVWRDYPRPQMRRHNWLNLNGLWDYAITKKDAEIPAEWDGKILVPFPVESALSGVKKSVGGENALWYRRKVTIPEEWQGQRLILHFGAVDWRMTLWINGKQIGKHSGGCDAFSFDITDAVTAKLEADIVISVWDPTDDGYQPRGKQVNEPQGIWYTSVTGIWQTVWMEAVPQAHINSLKITPDVDNGKVRVEVETAGIDRESRIADKYFLHLAAISDNKTITRAAGNCFGDVLELEIPDAELWSPDNPFLYDLKVTLTRDDEPLDEVTSYFAMRKFHVKKDESGINRIYINGKPIFLFGTLDQGWWPGGLYTPPSDEAMRYDIEVLKELGMNCIRKHVKVEPLRYYYHCDRLGMIVWQDMPNGDKHISESDPDITRTAESETNFRAEWKAIVNMLYNNVSIAIWCPFNEGWGQFKTNEILEWTKQLDPTRLVDGPSGWTDRGGGDMYDMHNYPGPGMFPVEESRVSVLGEFGGLGLPLKGHLWWDKRNWGYRSFKTREELNDAYINLITKLPQLISKGLAAAIYTQTTDVEGEVNGLMTYDRKVLKLDADKVRPHHLKLYQNPPE
ncbi:Beta-galactosidase [Limihaloglobus sulfuriphilus]|uniref:Beta-galactosidase n=1 Tax=Limihaloglobus sulfuriphilus TaxID=1851148 RepID=A0A1Q2MBJ1_9BACT|nr:sugar-binding domain-containing protein [Limihaloglobus sulfuriphilus]AQQ70066.1 Beta-galactosidase [Limihaloglobus sulfuriphilus]